MEKTAWQAERGQLREAERKAQELMAEGLGHLARAKARHDQLEALYRPHVDFAHSEECTRRLWQEIQALPDC